MKGSISSIDIRLINISHEIGRGASAVFEPVVFKGLKPDSTIVVTIPAPFVNPANEVNIGSGICFVKLGIMTDIHIGTNGRFMWLENWDFCNEGYDNPWNGCLGDDRQENCILQNIAVRDRLNSSNLDYVMLTGDFTQSAEREEFECFKALIADSLYSAYFPILGNHDTWPNNKIAQEPQNELTIGDYYMRYGGFKRWYIKLRDSLPVANFRAPSYLLDSTTNYEQYDGSSVFWPSFFTFYSFDVWKIIYDQEDHPKKIFTDPDPLDGENESATYFACRYNSFAMDSFYHTSKKITAAKPVQCPLLYVYTDSGYVLDNSLLPRSEYIREDYLDRYRLNIRPISNNGILRFMITDNEDITYIDQIKLLIVDHLRWIKVGVLPDGRIIPYTETVNPFRAVEITGVLTIQIQ